jgi:hypothetical protein
MAYDQCDKCPVKEALVELATVVRNALDNTLRFTWSEKAGYMNEVDDILKRLSPPVTGEVPKS